MVLDEILNEYNISGPVDIEAIASHYGAYIIRKNLGNVDGILVSNYIGVNSMLDHFTQRFVIAHEFCHFLLGEYGFSKGIYHSTNPKEKRADDFATKILLPKDHLIDIYMEYANIPTISQYFGVPSLVVEKRLNNLIK